MTSTEVVSSGAGVFCSTAGERGLQGDCPSARENPQESTETHQEPSALRRVAYCPGMCEARSKSGQSLFPKQAALVSTVARAAWPGQANRSWCSSWLGRVCKEDDDSEEGYPLAKWRHLKSTSNPAPFCSHLHRSGALIPPDSQDKSWALI